jgi:hypothetical protein
MSDGPTHAILEIDATTFLDVIHKYPVDGPQTTIDVPIGSTILCAKAMPDATIKIWARRPIDEAAPMCQIGIWVFGTGQPMPKGEEIRYLDTVIILERSSAAAPGAVPRVLVFHVFVLNDSLTAGSVTLARG